MNNNDGWILISNKKTKKNVTNKKNKYFSKETIIEKLKNALCFKVLDIKSVFLFGSVAKNKHTESSDIDIMVIWNKNPSVDVINNLKCDIINLFDGKKIDLISMKYTKKIILDIDDDIVSSHENRIFFIENVYIDAISIIGNTDDIKFSFYISKN